MRQIINSIKVFSSFEDENHYEYERRKKMTPEQSMREFAILQERRWGADWTKKPIVKKITIRKFV